MGLFGVSVGRGMATIWEIRGDQQLFPSVLCLGWESSGSPMEMKPEPPLPPAHTEGSPAPIPGHRSITTGQEGTRSQPPRYHQGSQALGAPPGSCRIRLPPPGTARHGWAEHPLPAEPPPAALGSGARTRCDAGGSDKTIGTILSWSPAPWIQIHVLIWPAKCGGSMTNVWKSRYD